MRHLDDIANFVVFVYGDSRAAIRQIAIIFEHVGRMCADCSVGPQFNRADAEVVVAHRCAIGTFEEFLEILHSRQRDLFVDSLRQPAFDDELSVRLVQDFETA